MRKAAEVDRYIEANTGAFEALKDAKWKEDRERYSFTSQSMARIAARLEIQKQLPLLTFEEFLDHKRQGTDFFYETSRGYSGCGIYVDNLGFGRLILLKKQ
jgi:hypothetical protein